MGEENRRDDMGNHPVASNYGFPWRGLSVMFLLVLGGSVLSGSTDNVLLFLMPLIGGFIYTLLLFLDEVQLRKYWTALAVFLVGSLACLVSAAISIFIAFLRNFNGFW